jgi:hypothetical protein
MPRRRRGMSRTVRSSCARRASLAASAAASRSACPLRCSPKPPALRSSLQLRAFRPGIADCEGVLFGGHSMRGEQGPVPSDTTAKAICRAKVVQHASKPCAGARTVSAAGSLAMSARRAPAAGGGDAQAGAEKLPSCEPDSTPSTAASSAVACTPRAAGSARLSSSTERPLTCCSTACGETKPGLTSRKRMSSID